MSEAAWIAELFPDGEYIEERATMLTRIRRISDNSIHTFETPIGETMLVAYEVLRMGLIRVLGVLLRAKLEGELVSVKEAMQALRADAGFFIADDLFEATLTEAGEQ